MRGEFKDGSAPTEIVAVKHIIPQGNSKDEWARVDVRVRREIVVWMRLKHDNIVALLGTVKATGASIGIVPQQTTNGEENRDSPTGETSDQPPFTCHGMVSHWMMNGNLDHFIKENLELGHRFQIACDVAAGLTYLHSEDIIHGDLTSANVLIDDNGRARLVDFGLSSIMAEFENTSFITSTIGGYLRFRALELMPPLDGSYEDFKPVLTPACDVYSLGSVVLQILTGKLPYHNIIDDTMVALVVAQRKQPARPSGEGCEALIDKYWNFIVGCWNNDPNERPSAEKAQGELIRLLKEA
ncbi:hypothetical protein HWV62_10567 [Athelia sp. TMB]|nr:hypothetical protein HWV62_10567 [Athelia sp. TMB]